jgi:hypothetical protein
MLEFVVNHSINKQTSGRTKDITRNHFCYTGYLRKADDAEIQKGWRASPIHPPDWSVIKKELKRRNNNEDR